LNAVAISVAGEGPLYFIPTDSSGSISAVQQPNRNGLSAQLKPPIMITEPCDHGVEQADQECRNSHQPKETVRLALNTVARTYCWRPKD
jgi:hypothetical protein